ncbi:DMT family transporter [Streptomyces sp. JNUCC 64]
MSATVLAVALSLLSAVAYATAAVLQRRLAVRVHDGRRVRGLLGAPAWWGAVALNGGAALLHVAALRFGPLTLVQPLGALTLVVAVPLGARLTGRRVDRREWRGVALTLAGLGALTLAAAGPAPARGLSPAQALTVAAVAVVLLGALARPGARPGQRHATASGIASGVASALTQTLTVAATGTAVLFSGRTALVAALVAGFATAGLLLAQAAYRDGLGAPLALLTLANPVAAAVIGLALLGEGFRGGGPGLALAVAGAAVAGRGVLVLSRAAGERGTGPSVSRVVASGLPAPRPGTPRADVPDPARCR